MRKHTLLALLLGTLLGAQAMESAAIDIDVFFNQNSYASAVPNVLIYIDNSNWTRSAGVAGNSSASLFDVEQSALTKIFNTISQVAASGVKFNVGLLLDAEKGGDSLRNSYGAYLRAGIRPMTPGAASVYSGLFAALGKTTDAGAGNTASPSLVMAEVYRYLSTGTTLPSAGVPLYGNLEPKADYAGNVAGKGTWNPSTYTPAQVTPFNAIYNLAGNALSSLSAALYTSPPKPPSGKNCVPRNFLIYVSNGPPKDSSEITGPSYAATAFNDATSGSNTAYRTLIPISPSYYQQSLIDEWARFMKKQPAMNLTTYTIEVLPDTGTTSGQSWTAALKSAASNSSGRYSSILSLNLDGREVVDQIQRSMAEILAVNTAFASVSLPISSNTQGSYLNQVYIGMFRPDTQARPRWYGNLKQYKMGSAGTNITLQDADSVPAVNSNNGFITDCARSFWTPTTVDTYWAFSLGGSCPPPSSQTDPGYYQQSNYPDGPVVEKGAQAYVARGSTIATRNLTTVAPLDYSCGTTGLQAFTTANTCILQSMVDPTSSSNSGYRDRVTLINWLRGQDLVDENSNSNTTEARPSLHGDVLHSRPVALNFGTDASPQVVVFYGGNDGVFRAINGNRSNTIGSTTAGSLFWGFVPPEFYNYNAQQTTATPDTTVPSGVKRLYDNSIAVNYVGISGAQPKPYGLDGVVSAYKDGTTQYVYATLRRGGRSIYAFTANLSSGALTMSLAWRQGCPHLSDDTSCTTNFSGLGQTWSKPIITKVPGASYPVMLMGGGYDNCEDSDPNICTTGSKGTGIYVLDATTGAFKAKLPTDGRVISQVQLVSDAAGLGQYAYAADLSGNVYRIDISTGDPASWTSAKIVKIASLGCNNAPACIGTTADRKFMFEPDVVAKGGVNYILIGSGDREKPLLTYSKASATKNFFFMIQDKPTDTNWPGSVATSCTPSTVICTGALLTVALGATVDPTQLTTKAGWMLTLDNTEMVATSSLTLYGTSYFSTFQPFVPNANDCSMGLGTTYVYNMSYLGAASSRALLPPVGLPPSPVAGMVKLDTGATVPFCIGCDSSSPLQAVQLPSPPSAVPSRPKIRSYWFIKK